MDQSHDLILAAVQDYDWNDLRLFVTSLRATGFDGEVHFFGSGLSRETVTRLESAAVSVSRPVRVRIKVGDLNLEPFRTENRRLAQLQAIYWHLIRWLACFSGDRQTAIRRYTAAVSNLLVARFFWYLDFLSQTQGRYQNVMITDVRDVVFLGNPFDFPIGNTACFFLEDDRTPINQQWANTRWIIEAYGPRGVVDLGNYPICCAGVTIGSVTAVIEYLKAMVDQLMRLRRQAWGVDQGVHNYVLRKGLVRNARLVSNGAGPVLTVGIMSDDDAYLLYESCASRVKVLHQYDRRPGLAAAVHERFRS